MIQDDEKQTDENLLFSKKMIGQRFRQARESLGLTRKEWADLANSSYAAVRQVEEGQDELPTDWLERLTIFFNIDANWLLTGMATVPAWKKGPYEELIILLQVPEVGKLIDFQLRIAKVIFSDKIKEDWVPKREK